MNHPIVVTELTPDQAPAWDAYVRASAHGLPLHLSGWQAILAEAYGYETHFLMACINAPIARPAIVGVMPLLVVKSWLTGNRIATLPGGLCAESQAAAQALAAAAERIAREKGVQRIHIQDARQCWLERYQTVNGHVGWIVDLGAASPVGRGGCATEQAQEEAVGTLLHRNIRRQIRLARENDLTIQVDRSGALVKDFYRVLSRFTHEAGTPLFGIDFLESIVRHLSNHFNIVVVYLNKVPIGGYFQLEMGDTVYGMWGAALHDYLKLRPVYLAYWTILLDAAAHGFRYVDMGRSPAESNAAKFKKQWGGQATPIYQQTLGLDGAPVASMTERTQNDSKLTSFMQIWPRIPYPVAQYLGPKLRKHVPFA